MWHIRGLWIQEYVAQWPIAVYFTLCLLTHPNMGSTKLHTSAIFRGLMASLLPVFYHKYCTWKIKLICIHGPTTTNNVHIGVYVWEIIMKWLGKDFLSDKLCYTIHKLLIYAHISMNSKIVRNRVVFFTNSSFLLFKCKTFWFRCWTEEIHFCKIICTRHYCAPTVTYIF
jgi:hypothetical protein